MQDLDLKLFFDPIPPYVEIDTSIQGSIGQSIFINQGSMPDYDGLDIALIGLVEGRGEKEDHREGIAKGPDAIRQSFYSLKKGSDGLKVVDLGNFRNGPDLEDTYLRLKEVCSFLMRHNIVPVFFGGSHDMTLGQYFGYEDADKLITVLNVDNKLDLGDPAKGHLPSGSHIQRIIKHDPNYLFNYYHLGYQSYLVGSAESDLMERLSFEAIRLGVVKENIKDLEPVVRDADMMSIDVSALQAQYAPGALDAKVYGLTGEEACQICWYAGLNDKLSSVGIYGYDQSRDDLSMKTSFVIATMVWYFIEGFYNRKGDKNFRSNDYLIYEVPLGGDPSSIKFFKSKISEKWWMEVPHPEETDGFMRSRMIPCNYSDYEKALDGDVPNRWITTYSRFT
ncbi:formimidoylglutamase [Marinoscillum sp. MHG1-6]|uniref:formimidoylglutamase n=1 Tax=Marinoscillum sp. MHG1-6 TaxID=2959627 RepID=UPI0021571314|nr:formimidoylglutamase [Marinoscillum sp. MHG1-6]